MVVIGGLRRERSVVEDRAQSLRVIADAVLRMACIARVGRCTFWAARGTAVAKTVIVAPIGQIFAVRTHHRAVAVCKLHKLHLRPVTGVVVTGAPRYGLDTAPSLGGGRTR